MDFSAIYEHPDKEEIIGKLVSGSAPKEVNQWLKLKYPDKNQSHLRLTIKILKEFANSEYVDCYDQFAKDLATVQDSDAGKIDKKMMSDSLQNNKTYRERLQAIADDELDIRTMLRSLIVVVHERAEQCFDKIQEDPHDFRGDPIFLKYMNELFNMVEKFDKIVNNAPDQIIQHNFTLQAVEDNTNAILEAVRDTIAQLDPDVALKFMDLFYNNLSKLRPPEEDIMSQEDRLKEAQLLHEKIVDKK